MPAWAWLLFSTFAIGYIYCSAWYLYVACLNVKGDK